MTDLEQRLADALAHGAEDAPAAVGLAGAARARARSRRRTKVGVVGAAVALCIAVPTAVVAVRGSSDSDRPGPSKVATDGSSDRAVPDGYRVESWHSATILVPDSWGWGNLASYCADGGSLTPRVQRPGGVAPAIGCTPPSSYGISFQAIDNDDDFEWPVVTQDPKSGYPPGAYVGGRGIGGVLVMVTAPTQAEGLDVLATMRAIGPEGDPNGCPVEAGSDPVVPKGDLSICRYDQVGLLEQSELLTGEDPAAAEAALGAAPEDGASACSGGKYTGSIRMTSAAEDVNIDLGCGVMEVVTGGTRQLTPEVLYWALSPGWSGSVPEGVSLPSELRQH